MNREQQGNHQAEAYPLRRVVLGYLLGTGVVCGAVYALLLGIWQTGWREPVLILMSLLNLHTIWQVVLLAANGVVFALPASLLTAGMALGCRPYLRPFWLLCSALLAALGAAGPCLLLNLPHPPAWTLPGWPEPVFGDAPPWYLLAAAGGISGWLMAYWWLPYAEDEQSV